MTACSLALFYFVLDFCAGINKYLLHVHDSNPAALYITLIVQLVRLRTDIQP